MGKVLFIACTNVGIGMIEEIMTNENIKATEIVGIVNLHPEVGIKKANYQTYVEVSAKYNIPLHYCRNINDPETLEWMRSKEPDLIIQTGWSQKFSNEVLDLPKYGCLGEHPAPLPKGRGAACINWAILTGETTWGDTFFQMVEQYDRGFIYDQEPLFIEEYDNVKTVYDKVEQTGRTMVARNIDKWSNGIFDPKPQTDEGATYYKRRRPEDGEFNIASFPAKQLHDFIRAQTHPYPGAFFQFNGKKVTILSSKLPNETANEAPGTLLGIDPKDGSASFVCEDGKVIRFYRVKEDSKAETWASDYFKSFVE